MTRWAIVVWAGLALAPLGLFFPAVLSTYVGPAIWIFSALLVVSAVVAWLAMRGDRRLRWALVLLTGSLSVLAVLSTGLVLALSIGQSPIVDVIGWPVVAIGTITAFAGAILSLRRPA